MFCKKCSNPIGTFDLFCTLCGETVPTGGSNVEEMKEDGSLTSGDIFVFTATPISSSAPVRRKSPGRRARKKINYQNVEQRYRYAKFSSGPKQKKRARPSMPGRPHAAPPGSNWPPTHKGVTHFDDLSETGFSGANAATHVKLCYAYLDTASSDTQGLLIKAMRGIATAEQNHFQACYIQLLSAVSNQTVTEATGEIAAALYMINNYPGWSMIWGFHVHSGAGIDQIWRKTAASGANSYMLVEAKGPGASLSQADLGLRSAYGTLFDQMEQGWVFDRLGRMAGSHGTVVANITSAIGVTIGSPPALKNFGGASKSYYGVTAQTAPTPGRVTGIVLEAKWTLSGYLSATRSHVKDYGTGLTIF